MQAWRRLPKIVEHHRRLVEQGAPDTITVNYHFELQSALDELVRTPPPSPETSWVIGPPALDALTLGDPRVSDGWSERRQCLGDLTDANAKGAPWYGLAFDPDAMSFSPDGAHLAVLSDDEVFIFAADAEPSPLKRRFELT